MSHKEKGCLVYISRPCVEGFQVRDYPGRAGPGQDHFLRLKVAFLLSINRASISGSHMYLSRTRNPSLLKYFFSHSNVKK